MRNDAGRTPAQSRTVRGPGTAARAALVALLLSPAPGLALEVGVAPATRKILPDTPTPDGREVRLEASRNEWEAVQLVIRDAAGAADVDVELGDLCGPGGPTIPADGARLYREHYLLVDNVSPGGFPPHHPRELGYYPDPLIPFDDPYSAEDPPPPVGAPFSLEADEVGAVLVDWYVPAGTPPGEYSGELTVTAAGQDPIVIPVHLTVWEIDIPAERTIATSYGISTSRVRNYHGGPSGDPPAGYEGIVDRYYDALHEHRVDPTSIPGSVSFEFGEDGELLPIDWTEYDATVGPWLDGSRFADGVGVTRFNTRYFRPGHGTGDMTEDQWARAGAAFAEHLEAKGWWDRAYVYARDEPWLHSPEIAYPKIAHESELLFRHTDLWRGHILVTSPWDETIADQIGIWCPVTPMYEDWYYVGHARKAGRAEYAELMAQGQELWFYVCNANFPPYAGYDIDTAIGYEPRMVKWSSWFERATGFLYWRVDYWIDKDPWNILLNVEQFTEFAARNGDGMLLFPGDHDGAAGGRGSPEWLAIDGPIVTYRLKQIRDGLEDWELFILAESLGAEEYAREQVSRVYTRFGDFFFEDCETEHFYCPDRQPWSLDENLLLEVRRNIALKVQHLLHPETYPDPDPPETEPEAAGDAESGGEGSDAEAAVEADAEAAPETETTPEADAAGGGPADDDGEGSCGCGAGRTGAGWSGACWLLLLAAAARRRGAPRRGWRGTSTTPGHDRNAHVRLQMKHASLFGILGITLLLATSCTTNEETAAAGFTAVEVAPETPAPLQLAVQACAGLHNRETGGSVYIRQEANDQRWLDELDLEPSRVATPPDFLEACVARFSTCVRYDYASQQELLPSILTVAAALGAVPLDVGLDAACDDVVFDATVELAERNTPYLATDYVFEHYAAMTTGLAMLNPGYDIHASDPSNPELTRDMPSALVDFVFSQQLFVVFLVNGCWDWDPEYELLGEIVTAGHWPTPIGVWGYNNSWLLGGYMFEAQTLCQASNNMGAIPTETGNLSFFSTRRAPILEPSELERNPPEEVTYDPTRTYVAFVIGDGDNVRFIMSTRNVWLEQRLADCEKAENSCAPITWSISPHLPWLAPDVLEWYYTSTRQTGKDYFTLPPSGHHYAYPTSLNEADQDRFVAATEADARVLGVRGVVHWDWDGTWEDAEALFLPKYARTDSAIRGVFPMNVPYMNVAFSWWEPDQTVKVLRGEDGGEVAVFRPEEWRGIDDDSSEFYLSPQKMAEKLGSYPPGTVTWMYMTSDGGLNLENSFMELVKILPDHIQLVSADTAAELAIAAERD